MATGKNKEQASLDINDISEVGGDANIAGGNIIQAASGSTVIIHEAPAKAAGGFMALSELIKLSPDVHKAMIQFQSDLKVAHEQVDQLGDYKDLHDLLHNLHFSFYNIIVLAAKRISTDNNIWLDELPAHAFTFENIIIKLKVVASKPSMPKQELRWIDEAEQMKIEFGNAIEKQDEMTLKSVIGRLQRLLTTYPSRINTALHHAAGALRLPALVLALTRVGNDLPSFNLDTDKVKTFRAGVEALDNLEKALSELVDKHDMWQSLEVELHQLETSSGRDLDQFKIDWPYVKQKAETLYNGSTEKWANMLKEESEILEKSLSNNNPGLLSQSFRSYQRIVANRFFQVDLDLKAMCGKLRQIDEPLASVLELIK